MCQTGVRLRSICYTGATANINSMKNFGTALARLVRSRLFFIAVVLLLLVEAGWIAWSSRYPMAFDEGTHLEIISVYAHQLSPFITEQPVGPASYGALVHNPSFLYHWLMSFPYRWLSAAFDAQTTVMLLRAINIAFAAGGLILFRRVLQRTKASAAITHASLLIFVLIPVVPLLAGQINYDNLLFLLLAWNLLLLLRFREQLLRGRKWNLSLMLGILSLGMLASLVKFAYLPLLTAIALYILFLWWRQRKHWRKLWRKDWHSATAGRKYSSLALFVIATSMFLGLYGVNLVLYRNLIPQCNQVLNIERCQSFGPWARNYSYAHQPLHQTNHNPIVYTGGWLEGMFRRSFFVINGPSGPAPYANSLPLPGITLAALGIFLVSLYPIVRYWRQIFAGDPVLVLLLFVGFVYIAALWGRLYFDYTRLDRLVAVNGRYLLLVILPVLVVMGLAYQQWLGRTGRGWLFAGILFLFLQGGGALSFIYFSNRDWYWEGDKTVLQANEQLQQVVKPLIINWPNGWKY